MLKERLNEANAIIERENKIKGSMQDNLKKAFMRGVCALNFEAMSILNPAENIDINQLLEGTGSEFSSAKNPVMMTPGERKGKEIEAFAENMFD